MRLEGEIAFITGAGRGIGAEDRTCVGSQRARLSSSLRESAPKQKA